MKVTELVEALGAGIGRTATEAVREQKERAYADRNLLAIAYATEIARADWGNGGYYYHDDEAYPVVWASTIYGQQSWHVSPELEDLLAESTLEESEPPKGYDGHTRREKNKRLVKQVAAGGGNRL